MIACDDVASIIKRVSPNTTILIDLVKPQDSAKAIDVVSGLPIVENIAVDGEKLRVTLKPDVTDYSSIGMLLATQGIAFSKFAAEEINLESAFMAFTKGAGAKI
jgi:ABC-2 type transport system ATP-binding protein